MREALAQDFSKDSQCRDALAAVDLISFDLFYEIAPRPALGKTGQPGGRTLQAQS